MTALSVMGTANLVNSNYHVPHELNSQEARKAEGIWIWLQDIANKLSLTTPINIRWSRNWISGSRNLAESWCRRQIQQDMGCNDGPLVLFYLMGPLRSGWLKIPISDSIISFWWTLTCGQSRRAHSALWQRTWPRLQAQNSQPVLFHMSPW